MVETVQYGGETFRIQSTGRYYNSDIRGKGRERRLHRRVWCDHHGAIPMGCDIHHIDGDWRNNTVDNLECVERVAHKRKHMIERYANAEERQKNAAHLEKIRPLASEWHASPEGREWHRAHGKKTWEGREPTKKKCRKCGTEFQAMFKGRAQFCSTACGQAVAYHRYFTERRKCSWCGKGFIANRHRATECCSRTCGNRKRGAETRKAA